MGGIAGWVSYNTDLTGERNVIEAMTAALALRGPADGSTWARKNVALGVRRNTGQSDSRGGHLIQGAADVTICFSGEIYNEREIEEKLSAVHLGPRGRAESHFLLGAYHAWGISLPEMLEGKFVLAVWDNRRSQLILMRDRIGVEPLSYYPTPDGVFFASEAKAIFASQKVRPAVDNVGLRDLLLLSSPPGESPWYGMHEVEPASSVALSAEGIERRPYWSLLTKRHEDDQEATIRKVRDILTGATRKRVSVGERPHVLLSGGLDSSAVTGLVGEQIKSAKGLLTLSVMPDEAGVRADTPYVSDVVELNDSEHENLVLSPRQLANPELRRVVIRARDLPVSWGDLDTSLYLAFKAIAEKSRSALAGDISDALFGTHPTRASEALALGVTYVIDRLAQAESWTDILRDDLRKVLHIERYEDGRHFRDIGRVVHLDGDDETERAMRTFSILELTWVSKFLLDRTERIASAAGINIRLPFTDHKLIDYVFNVPWSMKTFDGREKSILRAATSHVLPPSVTWRPKVPYPRTVDRRYTVELQVQARSLVAKPNHSLFRIIRYDWLVGAVKIDETDVDDKIRFGLERTLDFYHWLDMYDVDLMIG